MADGPEQEPSALPRIAIILAYNGGITDIHCDCTDSPLEVVIATARKDGRVTGRPITMLATPNPALVEDTFRRADLGPERNA